MSDSILYKYLDSEGACSMLNNRNLQFTNATYFNDPFDCHSGLIDCANAPKNELNWPPSEFLSAQAENRLENFRNDTWISCLSKRFDNPLMWSYYTNHKGVCIGLERSKLAYYLNGNLGLTVIGSGMDVDYRDIIQRPDYFHSPVHVFHYQLCTKGLQWAHEEEVRFAIIHPSRMFVPYSLNRKPKKREVVDWREVRFYPRLGVDCFRSIYLGCRMTDEERTNIIQIVKKEYPKMSVYQMSVNPRKFGFDAVPISD